MDFITKQVFFFIFCNSSPTCRGRRILAIYYVKVCNSNHPSTLQFFNAPKLARHDLSGTMCIQKLMPSGFFLFLHAFNLRVYIDWQKHHRRLHAEHLFHRFPPKLFFWYPPYTSSCSYFFSSSLLHPENSFSSGAQERQKKTQKSSPFKAAFFMPSFYRYHSIIHGILCQYYLDCNSVAYRFLL